MAKSKISMDVGPKGPEIEKQSPEGEKLEVWNTGMFECRCGRVSKIGVGMLGCSEVRSRAETWARDYDRVQASAVILIYLQIGCGLAGSVGAFYTGVVVVEVAISLFALVAIESSSQRLGRTYAALLFCSLVLDVFWFILFARHIWCISPHTFAVFSLKLTLCMQILAFSFRLFSSLLWIQMYRLGLSYLDTPHRQPPPDLTTSFLSPATTHDHDVLGGSIYDPAYYSSLFEDVKPGGQNHSIVIDPTTTSQASEARSSVDTGLLRKDDENATRKLQQSI